MGKKIRQSDRPGSRLKERQNVEGAGIVTPSLGMDPYLENLELWSAVHSRLIVAIVDELVEHLSEKYRVEVEKRVYFSSDGDSVLVGIPDVAVATGRSHSSIN